MRVPFSLKMVINVLVGFIYIPTITLHQMIKGLDVVKSLILIFNLIKCFIAGYFLVYFAPNGLFSYFGSPLCALVASYSIYLSQNKP